MLLYCLRHPYPEFPMNVLQTKEWTGRIKEWVHLK